MIPPTVRALGFLIFVSCLLKSMAYLSAISVGYRTGIQFDGILAGVGLAVLGGASWALGLAAGLYLMIGKMVGLTFDSWYRITPIKLSEKA